MSSFIEHFSHPKHPLVLYDIFLEERVSIEEDATCIICRLPVIGSLTYTSTCLRRTLSMHKSCCKNRVDCRCYGCNKTVVGFPVYKCFHTSESSDDTGCRKFFLHKTCATLPNQINHQKHKKHPLTLLPRRYCVCDVCGSEWKFFTYTCENCDFDMCLFCAFKQIALGHKKYIPALEHHKGPQKHKLALEHRKGPKEHRLTLEHFSHPKHPLILIPKEDDVIAEDATCHICNRSVIGTPTYTCTIDDTDCKNFHLHNRCAKFSREIYYHNHKQHPLFLKPCPDGFCEVCGVDVKFAYACGVCTSFNVCVFCVSEGSGQTQARHMSYDSHMELEHFSHPEHSLMLKEDDVIEEDATCHICNRPVWGTPTYTCTIDDTDCQNFHLHKKCAKLPREIHYHNHKHHRLFLKPCPDCFCEVCGVDVKFAYACSVCNSFNVCVFCVSKKGGRTQRRDLSSQSHMDLEHFSHPKHPLILKEDDIIGEDEICHVCNKPVIGSPTYTCSMDAIDCESFYLHKTCAELPLQINHNLDKHLLALLPRHDGCLCAVCGCNVRYAYACDDCNINVCVFCGFEQRVLHHEGHHEHILTLQREALFKCDACSEEAKDSSYVCTTCNFWIHKNCAFAPSIIQTPTYHHHPLSLIYSVPEMHRYFSRLCSICHKLVQRYHWLYYCHKCTFFVHMKCSTSKYLMRNEIKSGYNDSDPDLVQFPLSSEESLFHLIVNQCAKLQLYFQGEGENSSTISTVLTDDPYIIERHWSHSQHPLKHFQFTKSDNDNDSDNRRVLICDGCIQPITVHHPSYYACIQCDFFLHSFCAIKLPQVIPAEAFPFHPHHSVLLRNIDLVYGLIKCGACSCATNGFFYQCETCDMTIDIRCAFLPTRIKHEFHMHHSLVQRPLSNFICDVSKLRVIDRAGYACEFCSFTIDILCAFYPSRIKHRYDNDSHYITLRHPPFFYEGVFYCEICEEQVNNQWWLYHRVESDHSYHHNCIQWHENVKLGRTIETCIDDEKHALALVLKRTTRKNSRRYVCRHCNKGYKYSFFLECEGCGYLICYKCAITSLQPRTSNKLLQV